MDKVKKVSKYIIVIILSCLITYIVTISTMYNSISNLANKVVDIGNNNVSNNGEKESIFAPLEKVYDIIKSKYYDEIDEDKLVKSAIMGMVSGLGDPYSYYMDLDEYADFNVEISGSFSGVGLELRYNVEYNVIEVVTPIKNTPSSKTNIKTGDYVLAVNGIEYKGEELYNAVSNIRGEAGTKVTLTIQPLKGEQYDIEIVRAVIDINQIEYEMLKNNIGYIDIASFDQNVSLDFSNAYFELTKQGAKSIIIDLRNNPGGYMSGALSIANLFIKNGILVSTVDKDGKRTDYPATSNGYDIPIVILINESSASASEILTGALKDHGIATVVGTKSYGKGLIQEIVGLSNNGAVRVTIAEYYTPNYNKINKIGITPDVVIEDNEKTKIDEQLEKAIEILK
ncbi:MAG: S41 family peptidase [Clostridia bacterium]|nr:S41 family peptidase [Clostridia bacterium]